jgi:predicted AAA+ superfamily ATPase
MESLEQRFYQKYTQTNINQVREFQKEIDWDNRLIGIKGGRGVGKTTLILQYLKNHFKPDHRILYVSLDSLYFTESRLYDLADQFQKKGGLVLALDEVHKYPTWSVELKNIYDDFPELKIIFSGSSLLSIQQAKGDLSRRAVTYTMPGLSFREFLKFEKQLDFPVISLQDLLENQVDIALEISSKIKPLAFFDQYLSYGYYPFYLESKRSYHQKLNETIKTVLEVDIPQFENLQTSNIFYLKKLLQVIATSVPFKPNLQSLSQRTGISLNTLKNYLIYLENAGLISMIHARGKGLSQLSKPEKIYLHNTNLMYALVGDHWDKGSLRETFFLNQVREKYAVNIPPETDFQLQDRYYFEIGGKQKKRRQIIDLQEAWVVKDDIEVGSSRQIPLWLFGFLN